MDWSIVTYELVTFLEDLNKDREKGLRLSKNKTFRKRITAPIVVVGEKRTCPHCKKTFPLSNKYFHRQEGGLTVTCKNCKNDWNRENRAEKRRNAPRRIYKPLVLEGERVCTTCKKSFPLSTEFFHKQNGTLTAECKTCKNIKQRLRRKKRKAQEDIRREKLGEYRGKGIDRKN